MTTPTRAPATNASNVSVAEQYEVRPPLLTMVMVTRWYGRVVLTMMCVLCCVPQVQQILLVADKTLNGSFTLSFNGAVTTPLDAQALLWATAGFLPTSSAADAAMAIETALGALDTVVSNPSPSPSPSPKP